MLHLLLPKYRPHRRTLGLTGPICASFLWAVSCVVAQEHRSVCDAHDSLWNVEREMQKDEGYLIDAEYMRNTRVQEILIGRILTATDTRTEKEAREFVEHNQGNSPWLICEECANHLCLNARDKSAAQGAAVAWWRGERPQGVFPRRQRAPESHRPRAQAEAGRVIAVEPQDAALPEDEFEYCGRNHKGYLEFTHRKTSIRMIYMPEGEVIMGSEEETEQPVRRVKLSAYLIGKYEVSIQEFKRFIQYERERGEFPRSPCEDPTCQHGPFFGWCSEYAKQQDYVRRPVCNISWETARRFCAWAGLELPTEAQWESAARGSDERRYPWGDDPPEEEGVCFKRNLGDFPLPSGSSTMDVSACGAGDMAGSVHEWCSDYWEKYPAACPDGVVDPPGPPAGSYRVVRGGSVWSQHAEELTTTGRGAYPGRVDRFVGFRVAKRIPK